MGLIGAYNNGIGFGNISQRLAPSNGLFVVSGTQTGHLPQLNAQHYAIVTQYSIEKKLATMCRCYKSIVRG
jgi:L-ribulose-5-phosphate 4-epimerase